jgi:hypothetical protein
VSQAPKYPEIPEKCEDFSEISLFSGRNPLTKTGFNGKIL